MVKIAKEGNVWKLWEFFVDAETLQWFGDCELLTGEGDSLVWSGLNSMRILASGELFLTRPAGRALSQGCSWLDYGGPGLRGASYTIFSPISETPTWPSTANSHCENNNVDRK